MRTMGILIKREVIDHFAYFVAAAVVSGLVTTMIVATSVKADSLGELEPLFAVLIMASIVAIPGVASLGASQMHLDRNRNISAFLTALPVTRGQLFLARVLTGALVLLVLLGPCTVAAVVGIDRGLTELPFQRGLFGGMFWGAFLACFACYSIGLYAGWSHRSLASTLGLLPVVVLAPTVIIIKGFDLDVVVTLSALTLACLTAAWCRFSSSSL